jgi:hypothetical protein
MGSAGLAPLVTRWKPPSPCPPRGNLWIVGNSEVIQKPGLVEIDNDLLEADFWPGTTSG